MSNADLAAAMTAADPLKIGMPTQVFGLKRPTPRIIVVFQGLFACPEATRASFEVLFRSDGARLFINTQPATTSLAPKMIVWFPDKGWHWGPYNPGEIPTLSDPFEGGHAVRHVKAVCDPTDGTRMTFDMSASEQHMQLFPKPVDKHGKHKHDQDAPPDTTDATDSTTMLTSKEKKKMKKKERKKKAKGKRPTITFSRGDDGDGDGTTTTTDEAVYKFKVLTGKLGQDPTKLETKEECAFRIHQSSSSKDPTTTAKSTPKTSTKTKTTVTDDADEDYADMPPLKDSSGSERAKKKQQDSKDKGKSKTVEVDEEDSSSSDSDNGQEVMFIQNDGSYVMIGSNTLYSAFSEWMENNTGGNPTTSNTNDEKNETETQEGEKEDVNEKSSGTKNSDFANGDGDMEKMD